MQRGQKSDGADEAVQPAIARAAAVSAVMSDDRHCRRQDSCDEGAGELLPERRQQDSARDRPGVKREFRREERDGAKQMAGDERRQIEVGAPFVRNRDVHREPCAVNQVCLFFNYILTLKPNPAGPGMGSAAPNIWR